MYTVQILPKAMKDLADIPRDYTRLIAQHTNDLGQNLRPPDAKKLKGDSGYSQRVGVYRILYDIDDDAQIVTIYRIKHRRKLIDEF
ncbi:type II toxin-antitoxin system RelE/ParE family toxin [Scytonema sp. UIC 10036]|uniref:type II toxin-antitoxin system RelE/ParE family toxin n=1 Tax=Scytonema sp. UIC 10036 TaxID=2304196 RepID=UPI0012DA7DBA|nr:type II toxin-antitoxin system RelE/ParE family toxin [Scytonema sp. UIC 10036]